MAMFETERLRVFSVTVEPTDQNTPREVFLAFRVIARGPMALLALPEPEE